MTKENVASALPLPPPTPPPHALVMAGSSRGSISRHAAVHMLCSQGVGDRHVPCCAAARTCTPPQQPLMSEPEQGTNVEAGMRHAQRSRGQHCMTMLGRLGLSSACKCKQGSFDSSQKKSPQFGHCSSPSRMLMQVLLQGWPSCQQACTRIWLLFRAEPGPSPHPHPLQDLCLPSHMPVRLHSLHRGRRTWCTTVFQGMPQLLVEVRLLNRLIVHIGQLVLQSLVVRHQACKQPADQPAGPA